MEPTIKIACLYCPSILTISITNRLGDNVTCPRCGSRGSVHELYAQYIRQQLLHAKTPPPPTETILIGQASGESIAHLQTRQNTYILKPGRNYIGKAPEKKGGNNITLLAPDNHQTVSRVHICLEVRISPRGYEYLIQDLESTNGCYLREKKLTTHEILPLALGDTISLGRHCQLKLAL